MIETKINTFDIKGSPIGEVVFKFCLVCCGYKSRRGDASAQAITTKGAQDYIVIIQAFGQRIYYGKTYSGAV